MARISYPDPEKLSDTFQQVITASPLNIIRIGGHSENAALAFLNFGQTILKDCTFDPQIRELVILRISALSNTPYETRQHTPAARELGVAEEKIAAIGGELNTPIFNDTEKAVLRFADDVFNNVRASDETFNDIAALFSPKEITELMFIIGFYMLVCRLLATLDIDIED